MLTVMRFIAEPERLGEVGRILGAIDARRASGEVERRSRNDGYFLDLSDQPSWSEHSAAIVHVVEDNLDVLARARTAGAKLNVDIGVGHEDVTGVLWREIAFDTSLMELLAANSVVLLVTLYCTQDADDAAE